MNCNYMKKLIFIIIIAFLTANISTVFSQSVTVELSTKWNQHPYIFNQDSLVDTRELVITYKNDSDTSIYFAKVTENKHGVPPFPVLSIRNFVPELREMSRTDLHEYLAMHHNQFPDDSISVTIENYTPYSSGLWMTCGQNSKSERNVNLEIGDALGDVCDYMQDVYCKNHGCESYQEFNSLLRVSYDDITEDAILANEHDMFVMLKPGECYEDVFNLACCHVVKGTYTFSIMYRGTYDYVKVHDKVGGEVVINNIPLPEKVGDYQLYSGEFKCNTLTITF